MYDPKFCFTISVTVSQISAKLCFFKFLKIHEISEMLKMFCCDYRQYMWSQNFVHYTLSLSRRYYDEIRYVLCCYCSIVHCSCILACSGQASIDAVSPKKIKTYFWKFYTLNIVNINFQLLERPRTLNLQYILNLYKFLSFDKIEYYKQYITMHIEWWNQICRQWTERGYMKYNWSATGTYNIPKYFNLQVL